MNHVYRVSFRNYSNNDMHLGTFKNFKKATEFLGQYIDKHETLLNPYNDEYKPELDENGVYTFSIIGSYTGTYYIKKEVLKDDD